MKTLILMIIIVLTVLNVASIIASNNNTIISFNLDIPNDNVFMYDVIEYTQRTLNNIEYKDDRCVIGSNTLWLIPQNNSGINIQTALSRNESGYSFTLGIPALPLESY